VYRSIGYPVLAVSIVTGEGLEEVREVFKGRVSALAGKSGVGKSSLLNALQPGLGLRVAAVGRNENGRHTTTNPEMFPLEFGGSVVDTPGMREFGLWDINAGDLAHYFPEMRDLVGSCRFRMDCRHDDEPGCAIRAAVMDGSISPGRYRSYRRLAEELP
jgi:ribosome biogenesis GTPase